MPPKKKRNDDRQGTRGKVDANSPVQDQLLVAGDDKDSMLTSVVLRRLFEICNSKDLLTFRLVSKEWYSLSLPRFRREKVVIHEPDPQYSQCRRTRTLQWNTLTDELDVEDIPFSSFCLLNYTFFVGPPNSDEPMYKNMEQFWTKYGENIRKLELHKATIFSVESFKKAIFEDTPNLEELKLVDLQPLGKIWCVPDDGEVGKSRLALKSLFVEIDNWFPVTWRLLFAHFPKIQRLSLGGFGDRDDIIASLADALMEVSNTNKELTVNSLKLKTISEEQVNSTRRLLQLPIMKLTTLEIEMQGPIDKELTLLPVALQEHGSTLKKLIVWRNKYECDETPCLLSYGNFQDSFLSLAELDLNVPLFRNLHFLEQLPNLKKLSMLDPYDGIFSETDFPRMERLRLPRLKYLALLSDFHIPTRGMEMIVKVMPNMEFFQGYLLTPAFRVVCEHWTALTELEVHSGFDEEKTYPPRPSDSFDGIGDEGITGIVAGCEDERRPNITNLKNLKCLEIESTGDISDISIRDGFLHLSHLRKITVRLTPETSDEAYEALVEKCPEAISDIQRADLSDALERYRFSDDETDEELSSDDELDEELSSDDELDE